MPHDAPLVEPRSVSPVRAPEVLSAHERRIALALAQASMPRTGALPGGGHETVARYERLLSKLEPAFARAARAGLWLAEAWPVSRFGRPLSMLSREDRERAIERWSESTSRHERWLLRGILTPLKSAHFDDAAMHAHVGCRWGTDAPKLVERASWQQQMTDGRFVTADLDLACEVVVIGTGAGGAAMAYDLARRGRAVLLLEGGHYHPRTEFHGRSSEAYRKLYLGLGGTIALGNVAAPILAGRGVGGTTTINSGTCYRAPEHTLARWGERYGLSMLTTESLAPYFESVESMLGVAEASRAHLGGAARVVARGAELLRLSHQPLHRNAPGCDGQGVCCFGCPTGAKRSTDVSYVPEALKRGAQLVTGAKVLKIDVEHARARGVTARLASGKTLRVRADAVVVAGGALSTPLLLAESGLCGSSGWLGKNLSIHPATKVMALFDETIDMSRGIPQSYAIDEYARDGLMFEGASTPLDVTAVAMPWVGRRFMDVMDRYMNVATFGFMIQDRSRGSVRAGPGDLPLIRYDLGPHDVARMQRGIEILCEVFLRAGATRVMPMVFGCEEIDGDAGLEKLRKMRLAPGDFEVSAFHPLGTCRMGVDPARSCVGPDGEAHDVDGLYVSDGSIVPSSLGVNPQLTIMALSLRNAERLDATLSRRQARVRPTVEGTGLAFAETMSGTFHLVSAPHEKRPFSFSLSARSRSAGHFARTREVQIAGEVLMEGFGAACPLIGTLEMDVLLKRRIAYDFAFTADDGRSYRFTGHKSIRLRALQRSMTVLPGRILADAGRAMAHAEVSFDLQRDLWSFLRGFAIVG
jgi:choline dehydrogenase-like flavoprotein